MSALRNRKTAWGRKCEFTVIATGVQYIADLVCSERHRQLWPMICQPWPVWRPSHPRPELPLTQARANGRVRSGAVVHKKSKFSIHKQKLEIEVSYPSQI
jgi:hypothetical protein